MLSLPMVCTVGSLATLSNIFQISSSTSRDSVVGPNKTAAEMLQSVSKCFNYFPNYQIEPVNP